MARPSFPTLTALTALTALIGDKGIWGLFFTGSEREMVLRPHLGPAQTKIQVPADIAWFTGGHHRSSALTLNVLDKAAPVRKEEEEEEEES